MAVFETAKYIDAEIDEYEGHPLINALPPINCERPANYTGLSLTFHGNSFSTSTFAPLSCSRQWAI
tara:strand:+ start:6801 stop:6998 length:198 start_codon:yes stop_codon:yes gene_type:complete